MNDKELADDILYRVDQALKNPDMEWNIDKAGYIQNLILAVINSFDK